MSGTTVAFHGVYSPAPTGFGARLIAVGYAAWADGRPLAGALTPVSRVPLRPSLARLLGLILPTAGMDPREIRDRPLTVFSHFRHPDYDALWGAAPAFSPALPAPSRQGVASLRLRVPFGPSQVYAVDTALVDTTCFLDSIRDLEDFVTHLRVSVVEVTPEERENPDLLRVFHPDRLYRHSAQRAELTLFGGSVRAAKHLRGS